MADKGTQTIPSFQLKSPLPCVYYSNSLGFSVRTHLNNMPCKKKLQLLIFSIKRVRGKELFCKQESLGTEIFVKVISHNYGVHSWVMTRNQVCWLPLQSQLTWVTEKWKEENRLVWVTPTWISTAATTGSQKELKINQQSTKTLTLTYTPH